MAISLTKEDFIKRYKERIGQIKFPKLEDIKYPIFKQNQIGNNITIETNLSEIIGLYIANLINAVYQEP